MLITRFRQKQKLNGKRLEGLTLHAKESILTQSLVPLNFVYCVTQALYIESLIWSYIRMHCIERRFLSRTFTFYWNEPHLKIYCVSSIISVQNIIWITNNMQTQLYYCVYTLIYCSYLFYWIPWSRGQKCGWTRPSYSPPRRVRVLWAAHWSR